jgi:zinc transport system permease protein
VSILDYDFMQRALLAALLAGLAAPAIGVYLVQRRLSLIGDGIGHIALTGVGVGLLTGRSPVWTAMAVAVAGAVTVELIRERGRTSGDVALALLFYGGISGGVVLVSLSPGASNASLTSYLFGSPLTVSAGELAGMAVLAGLVLVVALALRPWLFAVGVDAEYARVSGLPVRALNLALAVTTAVTVTAAMRTVGLLLVSALMVVPVATANLLARSFRSAMLLAMLIGAVAAVAGIGASWSIDSAPGASIVLVAILGYLAAAVGTGVWRRTRGAVPAAQPPRPVAEPPEVALDPASAGAGGDTGTDTVTR